MYKEIGKMIDRVKEVFPKSFIYKDNELIIEPKNNIYFRIADIDSELEFKCKMIEFLSRPAHKGLPKKWQKHIREGLNKFLDTEFNIDDLSTIYTNLGGSCNRTKTKMFIRHGYDFKIII